MPTVLIVDDDKHTRALLERQLAAEGRLVKHALRVVHAGDGVDGLRLFDEERPDLVITDLLMPRMDGFRFCRELRARAGKVALFVLSGVYRDASISSRLREEFGASYYAKPYQIKDLVTAVDKHLQRLASGAAAPTGSESPQPTNDPRRGAFAETPLGRLLLDLWEARATGSLDIRRGGIEKRIDVVVGHPVAVSSNQRAETLGQFLVLRGVIDEKTHQRALELAHDEDKKVGEALIQLGRLTPADLLRHLTSQARFKITLALRWPDGVWEYRPNRELLEASKGTALDPLAVVFLGLRKSATLEDAARAVQPLSGRQVALAPRGVRALPMIARAFGAQLAQALEQAPPFESFLRRPFEPATTLPALEALFVTGCVMPAGVPTPAEELVFEDEPPSVEELSGPLRLPLPPEPDAFAVPLRPASTQLVAGDGDGAVLSFASAAPEDIPLGDVDLVELEPSNPEITITGGPEIDAARGDVVREYLRLQDAGLYEILEVQVGCEPEAIEAAYADHIAAFALEKLEGYDLGSDHAKLEAIHAAYRRAHEVLASPTERAAYDRERLAEAPRPTGSMSAELAFRTGAALLEKGDAASAVGSLREAVRTAPKVADYQAALGWALQQTGQNGVDALDQALSLDPDHAAAHEYLGRILAASGQDTAAAPHLERALDAQPPRLGALDALEAVRARRNEHALLERRYRTLLHRVQAGEPQLALRLWLALARIHLDVLKDRAAARTAFLCASRLAPGDPAILDALAELAEGSFTERADILRARWRAEPTHPGPGLALYRAASESNEHDAAFLAAATLAARGQASGDAESTHRRFRPRFLVRAMRPIDGEVFAHVRHSDDDPELAAIFALLEPAGLVVAPMSPSDLGVTPADRVAEAALPPTFAKVRSYLIHVLDVPRVAVAHRPDFGNEAHLGAFAEPLLLVGPELLASEDSLDLAFRLARALSFLWPGRSFAGSRPARQLRELLLAAVALGTPALAAPASPRFAQAVRAVSALAAPARDEVAARAARLANSRPSVNLSAWAHALSRSADRVGLAVCGDVVRAAAACRQLGGEPAAASLLDWATSTEHRAAREQLGVSIDV
jgi:CheY-like chemotaxis protein/tetratricopeptide (TPR) repeat protein